MKTIIRSMFIAGAVVMAAGCGSKGAQQTAVEVVDTTPVVAVTKVSVREVPQDATYTSTVQVRG